MEKEEREKKKFQRELVIEPSVSSFCFVVFPLCSPISFHFWYDMYVRFV